MNCFKLGVLYLYITDRCNLKCRHCWVDNEDRTAHVLPLSTINACIEQALPLGLKQTKITGGEPLTHDHVIPIIKSIQAYGLELSIETNATLMDDDIASTLAECGAAVTISIDGADASTHDAFRGVAGAFEAALAGMRKLMKRGVNVHVVTALHRGSIDKAEAIIDLMSNLCVRSLKFNPIVPIGRGAEMNDAHEIIPPRELLAIQPILEAHGQERNVACYIDIPMVFRPLSQLKGNVGTCPCTSLITLLADGRLAFCGYGVKTDDFILGHISKNSLASIWSDHPLLAEIRRIVPEQLDGVCQRCMVRRYCRGYCRMASHATYGTLSSPLPMCQEAWEQGFFPSGRLVPEEKAKC